MLSNWTRVEKQCAKKNVINNPYKKSWKVGVKGFHGFVDVLILEVFMWVDLLHTVIFNSCCI